MEAQHVCKDRPRIFWRSEGPMQPTIVDLGDPSLAWMEYEVDPLAGSCDCEGPECDPETCPRFGDDCSCCGARVGEGAADGLLLMDGGDIYCDECIEWVQPDALTLADRSVVESYDRDPSR
jgi:hypothetical protein